MKNIEYDLKIFSISELQSTKSNLALCHKYYKLIYDISFVLPILYLLSVLKLYVRYIVGKQNVI